MVTITRGGFPSAQARTAPPSSPAGHCDLHFGGRDASTHGVEVTDRRRGLHLVHYVPLHACGRPGPAPVAV